MPPIEKKHQNRVILFLIGARDGFLSAADCFVGRYFGRLFLSLDTPYICHGLTVSCLCGQLDIYKRIYGRELPGPWQ